MGLLQIGQSLISYTKFNYMRNSGIEGTQPNENTSDGENNLPASNTDSKLSFFSFQRSSVRFISESNGEKVGRMDHIKSRNGMFHKTRNILRKMGKLLKKLSKGDMESKDFDKLQKKMDKLSNQLTKISNKLGYPLEGPSSDPSIGDIDTVPIGDPNAEPDVVPDEPVLSAVLIDTTTPSDATENADTTPGEVPVTPVDSPVIEDTPIPTETDPTDPVPVGEEIPTGEENPVGDFDIENLGLEGINAEDQEAAMIALTNVEDAIGGFDGAIVSLEYEHFSLEMSLTFFELPEHFHHGDGDLYSYSSISIALDYTRLEIMTDAGTSIKAQTMSFSMDIVNLLY